MILDSSATASLFFRDNFTEKVTEIVERADEELITLDFSLAEISNVAWKRIIIFNEDKAVILKQLQNAIKFIKTLCNIVKMEDVIDGAINLAVDQRIPFYDSAFLYLASTRNTKLLTTDKKLYSLANADLKKHIRLP